MAYVAAADFRAATLSEYCLGLTLDTTIAPSTGAAEVWTVDRNAASSGTFTLTVKNAAHAAATTSALAWNASVSAVQAAIDLLANAPDLTVSAGVGDDLVLTYNELGPIASDAVVATDSTDATVAATRTTPGVATEGLLTAVIARMSEAFDNETNDHYESASDTLTLSGGASGKLSLPRRCTAVSAVTTVAWDATETIQTLGTYRLHSSLDAAGANALGTYDFLEIVPGNVGFLNMVHPYKFDNGVNTTKVAGTYGWTVTPGDVKRAVALLVYFHVKRIRDDLRMTTSVTTVNERTEYALTQPFGIPEADRIAAAYRRDSYLAIG